ncbi:MAG: hypothetical protein J6M94_07755, partial [Prevotella sp.]|nr:hypothetical protein [Prevotella sp.]
VPKSPAVCVMLGAEPVKVFNSSSIRSIKVAADGCAVPTDCAVAVRTNQDGKSKKKRTKRLFIG